MTIEEATEQQETTNDAGGASRDDLIAAVRAAGGTESVADAVAAEEAAAQARASGADAGTADGAPAVDPDEPPIMAKLKAREAEYGKRRDAEDYAAQLRQQAEVEAQRIREEARQKAEREYQEWLDGQRRRFQETPTEALRALGEPKQIVDAVLAEDSPHARELRELRAELQKTSAKAQTADEVKAEIQAIRNELAAEKRAEQVAKVRAQFLSEADAEKAPFLNARYEPDEIFSKADALATTWQKTGMVLGRDFDYGDLVAYLERDAKQRITGAGFARAPQQVSGASSQAATATAATEVTGKRPQGQANGSRTLSAATGSERRTSPRPLTEMTREEARQALIDEVAAARRANPDAML